MSRNNRTIQFSVPTWSKKREIDEYAQQKGFGKAGTLAQVALFQYMAKNPLKAKTPTRGLKEEKMISPTRKRVKASSLYSLKPLRQKKRRVTRDE